LFEPARRKPIPPFPETVGVVTSLKAAALRDVLTTLARRMPGIRIVLYPAPVQGEGSGERIAHAIGVASMRREVDVLIVCRGGGSMEDLWSFNEETVARAIVDCAIPVVSGVGHETDFTIADFVADARAPTPTAAAELVSPNRIDLLSRLAAAGARLGRDIHRALNTRMQHLDYLGKCLVHPGERMSAESRHLAHLANRLRSASTRALESASRNLSDLSRHLHGALPDMDAQIARQAALQLRLQFGHMRMLEQYAAKVARIKANLDHLSPRAVLDRGYSIVEKSDGQIVRTSQQIGQAESLRLTFARGAAQARVEHIEMPEE
jgi:exodeoxyribonuclease VII large subunit